MPFARRSFVIALSAAVAVPFPAGATQTAHIHGTIVSIDRKRGTFFIRHDPFPLMPMVMTMEVRPLHAAEFKALRVGEIVDATIDTEIVPWPASKVKPAPPKR